VFLSPLDELSAAERQAALALASSSHSPAKSGLHTFDPSAPGSQNASHATHPILGLLVEGERKWADLVDRQSRSLEEAVVEYKKRYGRNPPKGFDDWWSFAQGAQVWLPDEVRVSRHAAVVVLVWSTDTEPALPSL
jgi:beta-1,2-xylosyltransferase